MGDDVRWLIGISITTLGTVGVMIIGAMSRMTTRMDAGDEKLHGRINSVRESYVRRDDNERHLQRLETTLKEVRDEQRQMHQAVLSAISGHRAPRGGQQ